MYEMHAERDATDCGAVLLWHAAPPGSMAALCGQVLIGGPGEAAVAGEEVPMDRYCPSCMTAVGEAMAANGH
jgi:hypothetical protein